jgi:hypothetical protein
LHHGAPMPLPGFGRARDAAPVGSEVGGIGESSFGYAENNRTMTGSPRRGKIETLGQERSGAVANVLATWATGSEVEIVEDGDITFLYLWTPLQPGEGAPEDAIMTNAIGRTSISGPEATRDAHSQMFDRIKDHDSRKPSVARKALASIKKNTDTMESINAANAKFWGGNK